MKIKIAALQIHHAVPLSIFISQPSGRQPFIENAFLLYLGISKRIDCPLGKDSVFSNMFRMPTLRLNRIPQIGIPNNHRSPIRKKRRIRIVFQYGKSVLVHNAPGPQGIHSGAWQLTRSMGCRPLRGSHRAVFRRKYHCYAEMVHRYVRSCLTLITGSLLPPKGDHGSDLERRSASRVRT